MSGRVRTHALGSILLIIRDERAYLFFCRVTSNVTVEIRSRDVRDGFSLAL